MKTSLRTATGRRLPKLALRLLLPAVLLGPVGAAAVDWNAMAGAETVTISTTNEDGTARETTIWLLVADGVPYVRTGATRWGGNAERRPDVTLRVGSQDFSLRATPVTEPALAARLQQGFRAKYGWSDVAVGLMPGAGTRLFRLDARPGA